MTFKNLAKKARNRLKGVVEAQEKTTYRALSVQTNYFINASKPKPSDDPLYPKCKKMLEVAPDIISPIGKLIEKEIFDNLSLEEKDKYLLELTKRYHAMKKEFLKEKQNVI